MTTSDESAEFFKVTGGPSAIALGMLVTSTGGGTLMTLLPNDDDDDDASLTTLPLLGGDESWPTFILIDVTTSPGRSRGWNPEFWNKIKARMTFKLEPIQTGLFRVRTSIKDLT